MTFGHGVCTGRFANRWRERRVYRVTAVAAGAVEAVELEEWASVPIIEVKFAVVGDALRGGLGAMDDQAGQC